jgi:UDP-N-acetylmuramate dehydrogenase
MIKENVPLAGLTTFGVPARARFYAEVHTPEELRALLQQPEVKGLPKMILGGGSNLLFTQDYPGLLIRNRIEGMEVIREDDSEVHLRVGGGVVWHDLVRFAVEKGWGGIENLSLIPGTVGAAPIQNIGAYGVELKESMQELQALNLETLEERIFTPEECAFGYRDSVFKRELKGQYFILYVHFRLRKLSVPNVSYGAIKDTLAEMGVESPDVQAVSEAVCRIRRSKLPDPAEIGNAGSFFKNPEIPEEQFQLLKASYPALPGYPVGPGRVKVPAGWLIEQCGWKGKRVGQTGSHKDQALVLVNYGGATGADVLELARAVQDSVLEKFGIELEMEVNIV